MVWQFCYLLQLPTTWIRDCYSPSVSLADTEFRDHPAKYEHASTFGAASREATLHGCFVLSRLDSCTTNWNDGPKVLHTAVVHRFIFLGFPARQGTLPPLVNDRYRWGQQSYGGDGWDNHQLGGSNTKMLRSPYWLLLYSLANVERIMDESNVGITVN